MKLSILIPNRNNDCTQLVMSLHRQCMGIEGLCFDITIVDDGSDCAECIKANDVLNRLEHTRVATCSKARNRSVMRNRLQSIGEYEWVLSVNSNVHVRDEQFVRKYVNAIADEKTVLCGANKAEDDHTNLRCRDENNATQHGFRNSNYLCHRAVWYNVKYAEDIETYGWEDVVFGEDLRRQGYRIKNVDTEVYYMAADTGNEDYVQRIEESMQTLRRLESRLGQGSRLLEYKRRHPSLCQIWKVIFPLLQSYIRRNLTGNAPYIHFLPLYKLGYYMTRCE